MCDSITIVGIGGDGDRIGEVAKVPEEIAVVGGTTVGSGITLDSTVGKV